MRDRAQTVIVGAGIVGASAAYHLAELGQPICGEKVYNHRPDGTVEADASAAPRLALHAAELGFDHPVTGQSLHWTMPLPADLEGFLQRLRGQAAVAEPARPIKRRNQRRAK